jgi:hypothetical protein
LVVGVFGSAWLARSVLAPATAVVLTRDRIWVDELIGFVCSIAFTTIRGDTTAPWSEPTRAAGAEVDLDDRWSDTHGGCVEGGALAADPEGDELARARLACRVRLRRRLRF